LGALRCPSPAELFHAATVGARPVEEIPGFEHIPGRILEVDRAVASGMLNRPRTSTPASVRCSASASSRLA
jgi:hypothetical protein